MIPCQEKNIRATGKVEQCLRKFVWPGFSFFSFTWHRWPLLSFVQEQPPTSQNICYRICLWTSVVRLCIVLSSNITRVLFFIYASHVAGVKMTIIRQQSWVTYIITLLSMASFIVINGFKGDRERERKDLIWIHSHWKFAFQWILNDILVLHKCFLCLFLHK